MKRFILFLLTLVVSIQSTMVCFANSDPIVYADEISLNVDEIQLLPVNIKNNSGIMGFKISLEYESEYIDIKTVSKGSVTSNGNFNHNLGLKEGKLDIIWNSIENVKKDGSIFVLGIQIKKELKEDIKISISFSQEDTFNEAWEDVALDCKNIVISADYVEPTTEKSTYSEEGTIKVSSQIDDSQVLDAIDITLEQNNCEEINDVNNVDDFINDFNKNLEIITGTSEHNVTDFEMFKNMYKSAYEENFVTSVTNNIDSNIINSVIQDALEEISAKSINEINDKDKAKFVQMVEEKLKEQDADTPSISENVDTDDAIDIIKKLCGSIDTEKNEKQNKENNNSYKNVISVVTAVILVILFVSVIIILKRKISRRQY